MCVCVLWDKCKWGERTSTTTTYVLLLRLSRVEVIFFPSLAFVIVVKKERGRVDRVEMPTHYLAQSNWPALTFFWPTQKRRRRIWWRALSRHVSVEMNRCRSIWERPAAAVADDCRLPLTYSSLREETSATNANVHIYCALSHKNTKSPSPSVHWTPECKVQRSGSGRVGPA